jgi:hypothetical protein
MTETHGAIVLFNTQKIRRTWYQGAWWFSVVDVAGALTESPDPGAYWRKLKQRIKAEDNEVVTFCHGLKLPPHPQSCHAPASPAPSGRGFRGWWGYGGRGMRIEFFP